MEKDFENRHATRDEREERAARLLGRDRLSAFVSIRVAWLRRTLGRGGDAGSRHDHPLGPQSLLAPKVVGRAVMPAAVTITRLEKAAANWLSFGSSQTSMRIWLTASGESRFLVAASRADVLNGLAGLCATSAALLPSDALPHGAAGALAVSDAAALHRLLRRAFQLARTFPDALLHDFHSETANLPRTTEADRPEVRRVGQDIFRRCLFEYWDGRCTITGLDVPELLRTSHIKPWADCDTDTERLDVFNGLLLTPHLDAAFDAGFIKVAEDGTVLLSDALPPDARSALGHDGSLEVRGLHRTHERYLPWHRSRIFRTGAA